LTFPGPRGRSEFRYNRSTMRAMCPILRNPTGVETGGPEPAC
jgi:hypothetical protein